MEKGNSTLILLVALLLIGLISMGLVLSNSNKQVEIPPIPAPVITAQDKADIAQLVIANLPEPVAPAPQIITETPSVDSGTSEPLDNDKINALYEDSNLDEEAKAEEIVMAELNSKDFKKQLRTLLNDKIGLLNNTNHDQYGLQIESYKDIEDIYSVSIEDVYESEDDSETFLVEVEFKVKYTLDDDEDEMGSARLTVVYTVEELNSDDDFEDAEIADDFEVKMDDGEPMIKLYG